MTEKQGGSDVRANATRAHPVEPAPLPLVGHKWFCSAPMSDGFLTLARPMAASPASSSPASCPTARATRCS